MNIHIKDSTTGKTTCYDELDLDSILHKLRMKSGLKKRGQVFLKVYVNNEYCRPFLKFVEFNTGESVQVEL